MSAPRPPQYCNKPLPLVALSFRQPWLWMMLHLPLEHRKRIENRRQKNSTICDAPIWLHASRITKKDYELAWRIAARAGVPLELIPGWGSPEYVQHAIIGIGSFQPCYITADNGWEMAGHFGYPVRYVDPIGPVECSGKLSTWKVPPDVYRKLKRNFVERYGDSHRPFTIA